MPTVLSIPQFTRFSTKIFEWAFDLFSTSCANVVAIEGSCTSSAKQEKSLLSGKMYEIKKSVREFDARPSRKETWNNLPDRLCRIQEVQYNKNCSSQGTYEFRGNTVTLKILSVKEATVISSNTSLVGLQAALMAANSDGDKSSKVSLYEKI